MLELLLNFWHAALGPRPAKKTPPPRARRTPAQRRAIAAQAQAILKVTAEQDAHWRRECARYEQDARRRAAARRAPRAWPTAMPAAVAYCDEPRRIPS